MTYSKPTKISFFNELLKKIPEKYPFEYKYKTKYSSGNIESKYNNCDFQVWVRANGTEIIYSLHLPFNFNFSENYSEKTGNKFDFSKRDNRFSKSKDINFFEKETWNNLIKMSLVEIDNLYELYKQYMYLENYKISKINLEQINQFNNLELDLTYPKGHEKEGEPLEKICLIGQNGTGKTSIFKIIRAFVKKNNKETIFNENSIIDIEYFNDKTKKLKHSLKNLKFENGNIEIEKNLINFPADIIDRQKDENIPVPTEGIIDFSIYSAIKTWEIIKNEIIEYRKKEKIERDKIDKDRDDIKTILQNAKKLQQWEEKNKNPVKEFATKLSPFFDKFNLKVKTKIDFSKEEEINNLRIENLQNEELGNLDDVLSTGTKQILLTTMPLYTLKCNSSFRRARTFTLS